jgi:Domain of unknown function (DUF6268)
MATTGYRMGVRPARLLVSTALLVWLSAALQAQEPPPPPSPPPAQVLPPIAVPSPTPFAPGIGGGPRPILDPAPSINPFWAVLPPPAGPPLADTPPVLVDFWAIGQNHLEHSPSQFSMSQFSMAYDFRFPIGPVTFGVRPQFEVMFLSGPTPPGPDLPPQVYGLSVALEVEYRFSPQFSVRGMISPGLYTDFNGVTGHAFRLPAQVVGAYALTSQWTIVGGVMYTAQPSLSVLPVAGAIWTPADEWRLELTFPRLRVMRHFPDGLNIYGVFGLQGETYAIRADGANDLMQYRDVRLGLGAEWNTPIGLHIFVEAGAALFRRLEVENQASSNIDSGLYLRVGGRY